jgi:hypothetical protein
MATRARPKKSTDRRRAKVARGVRAAVESDRDRSPAAPAGATTGPQGPANGRGIACGRGRGEELTTAATTTLPAPARAQSAAAERPTPIGAPRPRPGPGSNDPLPSPRRIAPAVSPIAKSPAKSASPTAATPTKRTTSIPHQGRRRRGRWPEKLPSKPRVRNYPSRLPDGSRAAGRFPCGFPIWGDSSGGGSRQRPDGGRPSAGSRPPRRAPVPRFEARRQCQPYNAFILRGGVNLHKRRTGRGRKKKEVA